MPKDKEEKLQKSPQFAIENVDNDENEEYKKDSEEFNKKF
jgi:hypothetical protein